nr:DMT family transporter [Paenibacillus elgii]
MKSAVPYLQVAAAMLIVGSFVIVNKIIIRTFPVFLASELRLLTGAIIMTLLLLVREGRFPALTKRDWVVLFFQSFIGVFLFSFFMLYGLTYTTALESGIITSMTPVMVGLISLLFFRERLRWNQTAGIVCAVLGALAINIFGGMFNASWSLHTLWGNLLVLLAVAGEGVFLTFGKLVSKQVSPIAIATMTSLLGSAFFFAVRGLQCGKLRFCRGEHDGLAACTVHGRRHYGHRHDIAQPGDGENFGGLVGGFYRVDAPQHHRHVGVVFA